MRITIYNVKGGAGKTPIAVNIVLQQEWAIGTNEPYHVLDTFIPEERLMYVPSHEEFPDIPDDIDIVFDLAGSITDHSNSITSALKQSDLVIVPIYNEVKCLHAGAHTIREVLKFNKNILVVATKLEKKRGEIFTDWSDSDACKNIRSYVQSNYPDIEVLPLKFSTAFERIFEDEKSIKQLRKDDVLLFRAYKDVAEQFDKITKKIEGAR